MPNEKVYISRDEGSNQICVWRKPAKGNWSPAKMPDCGVIVWMREDIDNMDMYLAKDFKKKFGTAIPQKTKKCCHLPKKLLNNEHYKLFSPDPNRKQ